MNCGHSMISTCLFTGFFVAMTYISTEMGDRFSALLVSLMALRIALVDRNPFWPCFVYFSSPDVH